MYDVSSTFASGSSTSTVAGIQRLPSSKTQPDPSRRTSRSCSHRIHECNEWLLYQHPLLLFLSSYGVNPPSCERLSQFRFGRRTLVILVLQCLRATCDIKERQYLLQTWHDPIGQSHSRILFGLVTRRAWR